VCGTFGSRICPLSSIVWRSRSLLFDRRVCRSADTVETQQRNREVGDSTRNDEERRRGKKGKELRGEEGKEGQEREKDWTCYEGPWIHVISRIQA
jgi:hypothetical protein